MLPISESYSKVKNAFSENFTHFPVIKKTIEQFAFENAYESFSFLYATIPAESPSYATTFFRQ